jgi:hypothetical protein
MPPDGSYLVPVNAPRHPREDLNRMRILQLLLFAAAAVTCSAQTVVNGRVLDAFRGQPLAFVHVVPEGMREGTTTDIDGRFSMVLPDGPRLLRFSYVGYKPLQRMAGVDGPMLVSMEQAAMELSEVEIRPGENPALRIIEQAYRNRHRNDGLTRSAYRYTSYSKTIFTGDVDSALLADPARIAALDTSDREAVDFFQRQHILLVESATKRSFRPPAQSREEVLAMRVSGLKDPSLLAAMASTQTFSIYAPQISIGERTYVGPIGPGTADRYLYILEDTLYQDRDTVFVIRFLPRPGKRFTALQGVLYIHTDGFAVQNVIAEPVDQEAGLGIKIQQQHARQRGGRWFPVQLNTFYQLNSVQVNNFKLLGVSRTYLKDIEFLEAMERREFRGPELVLEPVALRRDSSFWASVRTDSLSAKELLTYHTIDSIGEAEGLDRKLRLVGYLATGRVPLGPVDVRLDQLLRYNGYEGLRAGLGLATNDRVSRHVSLGGYFAYGTKDKAWKYGGDLTIRPWAARNTRLRLAHAYDVDESGGVRFPGRAWSLNTESYRQVFVDRMDRIERFEAELSFRTGSSLQWWLGTERSERDNLIGYRYARSAGEGVTVLESGSLVGGYSAAVRYAPREQVVRTPLGDQLLPSRWPVFRLQLFHAVEGMWGGDTRLWRVSAQVDKTFRMRLLGTLHVRVMGGMADARAPYPFLFNLRGTFVERLPVAVNNTFETMVPNEFLADRYVALHLRHSFGELLFGRKKFKPVPCVVYNMAMAGLSEPQLHRGYTFKAVDEAYHEAGLQVDRLLVSGFSSLGVAAYHRFGPNQLPGVAGNFVFKALLGFVL